MNKWRLDFAVLALLLPVSIPGHADEARTAPDLDRLLALSMDALTQVQVSTASIRPATPREQPGAVTLITAQDMAAAGCRTLQDALRLVPGISSGIDVFNVTGLLFRGTWAYEGKILFLVDDMPVNDLLFGTYAIPPDFPVDILDRVEVLRGPGGAKYGENAELAVIRIYTRNSVQKGGFANFTMATQGAGTPLRQFSTGQHWQGQQGALALLGTVSSSNWGKGQWTDAVGTPYDTSQQHQQSAQYAMDATWLGSRLKVYGEQFTMAAPERYGIVTPDQVIAFQHTNVRLDHAFDVGAGVELTPRWSFRQEDAWHGTSLSLPSYYELPAQRNELELEATHALGNDGTVRAGVQGYWTSATAEQLSVPEFPGKTTSNYFQGQPSVSYHGYSGYAEAEFPWNDYRLSLGVRQTGHSLTGRSTVPRFALTRADPDWHYKLILDSAYREPQIETANEAAAPLKAERTSLAELEAGHRLWSDQYLTVSVFQYELRDAIVFSATPTGDIGYVNSPLYKGRGAEMEWRLQRESWRVDANVSYARTDDSAISIYQVTNGRHGQSLGAPATVFNLWASRQVSSRWTLNARLRYQGNESAYVFDPASTANPPLSQGTLAAEWSADLSARYVRGAWTTDVGIRNLFDEHLWLPQPYVGATPPYPYGAREGWARLSYAF
ncbi:MAG TPA: TonB-dependent receptor plug domain-containing protein [Moraxellaceae bacterium]|nr:TonB-dependent receptor plug domain-containing protein [Moraxellaceae bacterium]